MIKVMLIDDDADDREIFFEAVLEIGPLAECILANTATRALEQLTASGTGLPDIIFLDVNMPVIDGWQCLGLLKGKAAFKNVPVILYSTSSHQLERQKASALGAVGLMKKPVDFEELKEGLRAIAAHLRKGTLSSDLDFFQA
ncbi:response regulator [Dyadobacter arcticus]|uniref:CheY-like chemotaxis protein n=1 Tax=Dyadobacter arcticus TaxID=1078754 RepID=A0ABX0UMV1_9BACT|nr:response regulator [Dyadobacter arcticus]NIJ52965.1 CheY-like chemotaxis protein [Dyadobacter arcticus]